MSTVIPLKDESRRVTHFPLATVSIIAINVVVFISELMNGEPFVLKWAFVPANLVSGHGWITILTAMFMHGSWLHIISNMIFLWAFAPAIEDVMNPLRYAVFYLTGGVAATLAQIAANPGSTVPGLGASGAIAAVMGAFLVTYPADQIRTVVIFFFIVRVTYLPAALLIGVWGLTQLFNAIGPVADVQTGGVAYMAHVGGFVFGLLAARSFRDPRRSTY